MDCNEADMLARRNKKVQTRTVVLSNAIVPSIGFRMNTGNPLQTLVTYTREVVPCRAPEVSEISLEYRIALSDRFSNGGCEYTCGQRNFLMTIF
jgi:hypothetical protein